MRWVAGSNSDMAGLLSWLMKQSIGIARVWLRQSSPRQSRAMRLHRTRNLEIPRCAIAHLRSGAGAPSRIDSGEISINLISEHFVISEAHPSHDPASQDHDPQRRAFRTPR